MLVQKSYYPPHTQFAHSPDSSIKSYDASICLPQLVARVSRLHLLKQSNSWTYSEENAIHPLTHTWAQRHPQLLCCQFCSLDSQPWRSLNITDAKLHYQTIWQTFCCLLKRFQSDTSSIQIECIGRFLKSRFLLGYWPFPICNIDQNVNTILIKTNLKKAHHEIHTKNWIQIKDGITGLGSVAGKFQEH